MKRCANPKCRKPFEPKHRKQETCGANRCTMAVWRMKHPGYEKERRAGWRESGLRERVLQGELESLLYTIGDEERGDLPDEEILAVLADSA